MAKTVTWQSTVAMKTVSRSQSVDLESSPELSVVIPCLDEVETLA
jgi:hypothetical protein